MDNLARSSPLWHAHHADALPEDCIVEYVLVFSHGVQPGGIVLEICIYNTQTRLRTQGQQSEIIVISRAAAVSVSISLLCISCFALDYQSFKKRYQ